MSRSPRVPLAHLPRAKQSLAPSFAGSAVVHVLLISVLVWSTTTGGDYIDVIGGAGLVGGGDDGGFRVQYIELFPAPASTQARAETPRAVTEVVLPTPKLISLPEEVPVFARPLDPARVAVAPAPAPVAGPRPGTGRATGRGTGTGSGIGSGDGPGSGGGGGAAFPPEPRQIVLPPDAPKSIKGQEYTVHLWIDTRGWVTKIEVEPRIDDRGYRQKFRERMLQLRFYPARDASGQPVAARYVITVIP